MDRLESLSHSKWECKYHIVFIPKCRRKTLYKPKSRDLNLFSLGSCPFFVIFYASNVRLARVAQVNAQLRSIFLSEMTVRSNVGQAPPERFPPNLCREALVPTTWLCFPFIRQ